jgi:hypothetical protein
VRLKTGDDAASAQRNARTKSADVDAARGSQQEEPLTRRVDADDRAAEPAWPTAPRRRAALWRLSFWVLHSLLLLVGQPAWRWQIDLAYTARQWRIVPVGQEALLMAPEPPAFSPR